MPLTAKGEEIKSNMVKQYGAKKGEAVFYASKNKGTISGIDRADCPIRNYFDRINRGDSTAAEKLIKEIGGK